MVHMNSIQIIGHLQAATGKLVPVIAKEHGYVKTAFYNVINGKSKSPQIREIIADIAGKSKAELWPNKSEDQDHA